MKAAVLIALLALCVPGLNLAQAPDPTPTPEPAAVGPRFTSLALYLDSGAQPLAAYQLELWAVGGGVQIVGIEGGEHPQYAVPPYHDPKAMTNDRAILAALSSASAAELPRRQTRVATVHVRIEPGIEPEYELKLMAAGNAAGERIEATLTMEQGE